MVVYGMKTPALGFANISPKSVPFPAVFLHFLHSSHGSRGADMAAALFMLYL